AIARRRDARCKGCAFGKAVGTRKGQRGWGGTPVENRRARKSGSGTTFVEGGAVRVRSRQRASCARKRGSRRPASEADSWRKYQGRPGRCERNPGAIN